MANGIIFDIQRFSLHDGPGIRTNVFLKGCPLRCIWCHNPEGQRAVPQLLIDMAKCIGCGDCATVCPQGAHAFTYGAHAFLRERCTGCGACVPVCVSDTLSLAGRRVTSREVICEVMRDADFFAQSGGGMIVSGGEPFFQPEFLLALLHAAHAHGISCCIETSGFAPWSAIEPTLPYTEYYLFDLKEIDDEVHRRVTGVPFAPILANLREIDRLGGKIILRCPIIPGINNTEEHVRSVAALADTLRMVEAIHLEPYHTLGLSKSERLGETPPFTAAPVGRAEMTALLECLQAATSVPASISL